LSSSKGKQKEHNPTFQTLLLFRRSASGSIMILWREPPGDPDSDEIFSGLSLRVEDIRAGDRPYIGQEEPGIPGFEKTAGHLRRENQRSLIIPRLYRGLRFFGNLP
jgi:hypothetical protein